MLLAPALAAAALPQGSPAVASAPPSYAAGTLGAATGTDVLPTLERSADEEAVVAVVEVADTAELDRLVATGVDLDHGVERHGDHLDVKAVVTPSEMAVLRQLGFSVGDVVWTADDARRAVTERAETRAEARQANRAFAARATNPDVSDVRIIRADYYVSFGVGYLSVEAKWADGQTATTPLTVERDSGPGTEIGTGGTQVIQRFVDADVYLYHRGATAVPTVGGVPGAAPVRPSSVRITSPSGDVAEATVRDWLPTEGGDPFKGTGDYQQDFVRSYHDPTQLYDRVEQLAADFPELTDLVALPNKTNGYRRVSQALVDPPGARLVLRSGGAAAGEVTYVPRTGTVGTVPADGLPATSTPVVTVAAAANPAWPLATPAQGCGTISGLPAGAIALVDRGECTFAEKAANAQAAGASAVVVVNNVSGAAASPGNIPAAVTVPVVGISQADGARLRALTEPTARLLPGATLVPERRFGVDSEAWGHEGGDDVSVQVVDPRAADQELAVAVAGKSVQVSPATDASGAVTSTAAAVVAALNADPRASALLTAYTYRGSAGTGTVLPTRLLGLDDNLNAPDRVSHEPQTVYALRIGTAPEGTKPGVFAYAQEHAREWVPPLVTIETAERLLRNYSGHAPTKDLVDNLEVWIMPSVNPDGGHYSFFDFASQRRNMVRYCPPTGAYDAGARNSWGVDVNRNYDAYSRLDGYDGASDSCTSDVFSGPAELSEAESRNVDWVAAKPNMKFSMNMHSSGNYFMWSPGAYKLPGRVSAPRPTLEQENYFWQASNRILTAIKRHRGLSVTPARTGVTSDVLYSAAGNSGDMNWYKHGLYAWNFEVGTAFQPPFESTTGPTGASAHQETMEYANGLVELMRVARDLDQDAAAPTSTAVVTASSTEGKVSLEFSTDEAAEVRYTLDGTAPTRSNPALRVYQPRGVREGGELLTVDEGAQVRWYAVDTAGNVERGYDPADPADRRYRKAIAEVGWDDAPAASTLTLQVRPAAVRAGAGTVRATVTAAAENPFGLAPSGPVAVTVDGTTRTVQLDAAGRGEVVLGPFTTAGRRTVTAAYAGDDVAAAATAAPATVQVAKAASTTRVVRQAPRVVLTSGPPGRTRAVLRVRVSAPPGVAVAGPVKVLRGGKVVARGRVRADGTADLRLQRFALPGRRFVKVVYAGNADVDGSRDGYKVTVRRR
ncbi:M14 family zinc carboxypeptidase [Nocardioides litoris]|uniref:M14 family zinc carboxypeptidase n=1 Tax=Nocardioides litoris TaxID=1926648 RepID=UPI00111E1C99|nr:M14 family zinc carboxypeptidase [Nocardioides litoris]